MYTIYCIEDINDLKYVGSTKQTLKRRLSKHISDKRKKRLYSSSKLDLDNCKIYSLESCNESNKKERESYWINEFDTVNEHKLNFDTTDYQKFWNKNNKQRREEYHKEIYLFRKKNVVNGCYEFIKMLEEY